ncbi:MAG: hypothetical protein MK066_00740 [Crocinitomicaceae bacterium]|nr:hypothetical protein [Crocinitomicaceae bacterium]
MDYDLELKFQQLKSELEKKFGEGMDTQAILFLVGVNELGVGYREFSKQEKTDLLHVAICTLLEPYGYYEFEGRDKEQWPHFKTLKPLPNLDHREQQHLMKEALIDYFLQNDYFDLTEPSA